MNNERKILLALLLWSAVSIFTYGHAYKQLRVETAIECAGKQICFSGDFDRMEAGFIAALWPYHWSEYLWSKSA